MNRMLTVSEVAKIRNRDRRGTLRWLMNRAGQHLKRRGRMWYIEASIVASLLDRNEQPVDERIESRIMRVEAMLQEQERRLDVHARALQTGGLLRSA